MMRIVLVLLLAVVGLARADSTSIVAEGDLIVFTDYPSTNSFQTLNEVVYAPTATLVSIVCGNIGTDSVDWEILGGLDESSIGASIKASATILAAGADTFTGTNYWSFVVIKAKSTVADTPGTLRCLASFRGVRGH